MPPLQRLGPWPTRLSLVIVCAAVVAAFAAGQRMQGADPHSVPASQSLTLAASRKPTLSSLNAKLTRLGAEIAKLKKQLAANAAGDTTFLTRADADATFLKPADAASTFLKAADANAQFLRLDGTAVDSQKVGGVAVDGLFQGKGRIQTNRVVVASAGSESQLLGDGSVRVLAGLQSGAGQPYVKIADDTASPLTFTVIGASTATNSIGANSSVSITPTQSQLSIQVFGANGQTWTVALSTLSSAGGQAFAGQMLFGQP